MRDALIFVTVIIGAAASWYLRGVLRPAPEAASIQPSATGFYLEGAVYRGLDENGGVAYELAAARVDEEPQTSTLRMLDVKVAFRGDAAAEWSISASSAMTNELRDYYDLQGEVVIETRSAPGEEVMRIETTSLRVDPQTRIAETAGPIRLILGTNEIRATGLAADLSNETIALQADIHAEIPR